MGSCLLRGRSRPRGGGGPPGVRDRPHRPLGAGAGLGVAWDTVLRVLAVGLVAPIAGALLALGGAVVWRAFGGSSYLSTVRRTHVFAFAAQCVAYGANDGQKVLVLFLAAGAAGGATASGGELVWWVYPVVALAFAAGSVVGLPKIARSVGAGIMSTHATGAVTAEFAAAAAVSASAADGMPVSMTQAISGGLVGAGGAGEVPAGALACGPKPHSRLDGHAPNEFRRCCHCRRRLRGL